MLATAGLERFWAQETWQEDRFAKKGEWSAAVKGGLRAAWRVEWRAGMEVKPSLEYYRGMKGECGMERFLRYDVRFNKAAYLRIALRGGSHTLEVMELARTRAGEPIPRSKRFCALCGPGPVGDVPHFLLACPVLRVHRDRMWRALLGSATPAGKAALTALADEQKVNLLLGAPVRSRDGALLRVSDATDKVAMRGVWKLHLERVRALYKALT
jgi:hypothetical protein